VLGCKLDGIAIAFGVRPMKGPARVVTKSAAIAILLLLFVSLAHGEDAQVKVPAIDRALAARGLLSSSPQSAIEPPPGTEIDEYLQSNSRNGQELVRYKEWQEAWGSETLVIQELQYPTGQRNVAFWLLKPGAAGCDLFETRTYSGRGEQINASMWRDDPGLQLPGAAELPPDLMPAWIPPLAFLHAVNDESSKGSGHLHVQIAPYSVATLDVWKAQQTELTINGGSFHAVKVATRTDIKSFLPSWPNFVLKVLQPLVHENSFYFEADPPYRFLKSEGEPSFGGPKAKTELVRHYVAESSSTAHAR